MGLDIYHFKATPDKSDIYFDRDDLTESIFGSFKSLVSIVPISKIDWRKIFTENNLEYDKFRLSKTSTYRTDNGIFEDFYFTRISILSSMFLRSPVIFTDNPNFKPTSVDLVGFPVWERNPRIISKKARQETNDAEIIYCRQIGYQRNSVTEEFYAEFPPDLFTTDFGLVQRIGDYTFDDSKKRFHRKFIECWDPSCSFIQISW